MIKGKFGTITIRPPSAKPSVADEKRLYITIAKCIAVKPAPTGVRNA